MEIGHYVKRAALLMVSISLSLVCSACEDDCFVADTYQEIRQIITKDQTLYLYLKTSGFQEKTQAFQLYSKTPSFDDCGNSSVKPLAEVYIDSSAGYPRELIIRRQQLTLDYVPKEQTTLMNIEVTVTD